MIVGQGRLICFAIVVGVLALGCRNARPGAAPCTIPLARTVPHLDPSAHLPGARRNDSFVTPASFEQDVELPVPPEVLATPDPPAVVRDLETLVLDDIVRSVQQSYPLLRAAILERQVADGKQLASWGDFDLAMKVFGIAEPQGFYQTYRNGIALEQPLIRGGYLYGGYKIGDGNFQPWFGERETNEGGEFAAGFGVPLLKDRLIDTRRAAVFQADLARQAVEPALQTQMLEFVRIASQVYWSWVAAGQILEAQRELLKNAQARVRQIEERVNAGDLGKIVRINNEQLIAARESKVIEAQRKLQESAIKLSLFLRAATGEPVIPDESQLPPTFPEHKPPDDEMLHRDIAAAIDASPILTELDLVAESVRIELRDAENMLLPKLDARVLASKDVGAAASPKGDKTPFELEAGIYGELPLQRREARGKITAAQGRLAQLNTKRQFVVNKITAAVQDAFSALAAATGRIERANTNLRLSRETLELARAQFDVGDVDLIELNIYEQAVTDAQLLLIAAEADFFFALADYRAALSLEPIDSNVGDATNHTTH
jgi:outer membrane protein TolC